MPDAPTAEPRPPRRAALLGEARVALEILSLAALWPTLPRRPRGGGAPVLLLPGYGAGDPVMCPLAAYLRRLGYAPEGWGLGRNRGDVWTLLPRVVERIERLAAVARRPVRLVGWSLGGYLAREAARERPQPVERVVTLGSPVTGGPKYTQIAGRYRRRGYDLEAIEAEVEARERVPLSVPVVAIYSRSDGIVDWRACVDRHNPGVEHVEISASHLGMGFHPGVYRLLATRLADDR